MIQNRTKLTRKQLQAMYNYAEGLAFKNKNKKEDLQFFFHPLTPSDIYVKYTSYGLEPDNSILSIVNVICIKPDGVSRSCDMDFKFLSERMEFESGFIEVDIDANANLIFV